jgi:Na+/H+ antiporter NhaB
MKWERIKTINPLIVSLGILTPGIYFMHDVVGRLMEILLTIPKGFVLSVLVFCFSAIFVRILMSCKKTKWLVS